jgi:hypothetical protein
MANNSNSNESNQTQGGPGLSERASELKDRAGGLLQDGIEAVKNNPGATAAVIGGVAAAAAAYVNRDKIVETAATLREKVGSSSSSDSSDSKA